MMEQITAKVEANTNVLQKGNKYCREAMETYIEKTKADREATEAYPKRTESRIETGQEPMEAEIKTCLVEANSENK
jgi:hypothetical protein